MDTGLGAGLNAVTTLTAGAHAGAQEGAGGGRLVAADGRPLPLQETRLTVEARGGVARAVLQQRFVNPHAEPLRVTYLLPLPEEGAVAGFAFTLAGERVEGRVQGRAAARERFERALVEGHTAALLEEERGSLFTQAVGNVPPGAEVTCEVAVDQRLLWREAEGGWEWRFPTCVAPRYAGAPGRVPDARALSVPVADGPLPVRAHLSLLVGDALAGGARPESPSHALRVEAAGGQTRVSLAEEGGAALDRDVVVRWQVAALSVGVSLAVAGAGLPGHGGAGHALLTVVPPGPSGRLLPVARDLIVLLDTSGSMSGEPLAQAVRVAGALVDGLGEGDRLELVEFSDAPRRWKRGAVEATEASKRKAHAWLKGLRASGGTEMHAGILEALKPLSREAQRQVVLVTDGLIGFEREVVSAILAGLPSGARVHTVGVGSAVNRSLTRAAARAGRGLEVLLGVGEDPERAAAALLARTGAPQVVELQVEGPALLAQAPARAPDLYAGAPALLSLQVRAEGGALTVSGRTREGRFTRTLQVPATAAGEGPAALAALFARERVEDLEAELAAGAPKREVEARIEALGVGYQVSTRLTSWVAVSRGRTVDPSAPGRTVEMPHALPQGLSVAGLGLRPAAASGGLRAASLQAAAPAVSLAAAPPVGGRAPVLFHAETRAEEEASFASDDDALSVSDDDAPLFLDDDVPPALDEDAYAVPQFLQRPGASRPAGAPERPLAVPPPPAAAPFTPSKPRFDAFPPAPEGAGEEGRPPPEESAAAEPATTEEAPTGEAPTEEAASGGSGAPSRGGVPTGQAAKKGQAARTRAPSPSPSPSPRTPVRRGRGRLLRLDAGHLVATLTLDAAFTLEPGRAVRLRLRDGREVVAQVAAEQSTRAGPVAAGLTVRVVLRLESPPAPEEVASLVLADADGELLVTVEA
jgi:Ca-activated chloride channel family protein